MSKTSKKAYPLTSPSWNPIKNRRSTWKLTVFHQVHLSFFLRNFWQSPLLAFVFRLPAGSMSSSSSDHMLKSELTSPWLYCLGLKIEESWRLQYITMNNNEGICTVYKITKGSQLGHAHGQATSHWSLAFLCTPQKPLSHVVPVCKTCTVDWVYLRMLWDAASCLAFSNRFKPSLWIYTEMRNFIKHST